MAGAVEERKAEAAALAMAEGRAARGSREGGARAEAEEETTAEAWLVEATAEAGWEGEAAVARLLYREADRLKERLAAGELFYVKF